MPVKFCQVCMLFLGLCYSYTNLLAQPTIVHDKAGSSITISDKNKNLVLHLSYSNKCVLGNVEVMKQKVVTDAAGIFSAIQVGDKWFSTTSGIPTPKVSATANAVEISNIVFGEPNNRITERWTFRSSDNYIDWTIERKYPRSITFHDTGFPQWSFDNMNTWTGALLGTGGVAWCKLFDKKNASLANHTGEVALWNSDNKSGLQIKALTHPRQQVAVRFSRQPDDKWTLNYTAAGQRMNTKHTLSRFINDRQDIWDSVTVAGTAKVTYRLTPFNYDTTFYRGKFPGFNGAAIKSVLNTIARVGVIDENIMGSNNWHVREGYAVLHEQWIAQMGLGINDSNYLSNYKKTIDNFRDNAISANGRVKSRWAYNAADAEPGTYDSLGFYEAQWGWLLDSNTDQVINVAELFNMNGDLDWVRTHKEVCERVLEFLLRRDSDNDGLVEAMTDSYKDKRGSDWIDVIWASYENAFLNAKMYEALTQWSDVEQLLGDATRAAKYKALAAKLKTRFNQSTKDGGFWDEEKQWYVYWRDKDDRVHGSNLVTPVNFMAIAYNLCDDVKRQQAILSKTEQLMKEESLFMWPLSFFPYESDEGLHVNYPYPNYENGDIFLGWGEVGVRAYKNYDAAIPVKYIRNVLQQYEKDGLAFQRYDRKKGMGKGNDILANNSLSVVGLYRNIYGIQPKYNRLYLEPHLVSELNGTEVKYWLRGNIYHLSLSVNKYAVSSNNFNVSAANAFGSNMTGSTMQYFAGANSTPSLEIERGKGGPLSIEIKEWDEAAGKRSWEVLSQEAVIKITYRVKNLKPSSNYNILRAGKVLQSVKSGGNGDLSFNIPAGSPAPAMYEITPVN